VRLRFLPVVLEPAVREALLELLLLAGVLRCEVEFDLEPLERAFRMLRRWCTALGVHSGWVISTRGMLLSLFYWSMKRIEKER
jgi:hypothetical protein